MSITDELRSMAVSVGLEMPQAATLMMEAADTIISLRDRAQDLQAENAKLRHDLEEANNQAEEVCIENAKLRGLLKAAYNCSNAGPSCLECRVVAGGCTLLSAMRELGIEVWQ